MKNLGWVLIILLCAIPVLIWTTVIPLQYRFSGTYAVLTSIGQLLGLIGIAGFAVTMILSGRYKIFDTLFGGMNQAYIVHHIMGAVSFCLLLIHPIPLTLRLIPNSWFSAASQLIPSIDWALNFGISALTLMIALLLFTFFVDLPYHIWKWTHKFLGVAFFFAILHSLYITSDVTTSLPLRIYLLVLTGLGLFAFIQRTLLGRWFVHRVPYLVSKSKEITPTVWEITLSPLTSEVIKPAPGQFIFVSFRGPGVSHEAHPFSLTSPGKSRDLVFGAKSLGDFTSTLSRIKPETLALVEGPFGRFSYEYHKQKAYIWIAGGIGITPFISMIRSLPANTARIDLYYSCKDENDAVYHEELENISRTNPAIRFIPWYTKTQGKLTAELVQRASGELSHYGIFLCGPPMMMAGFKKQFKALGIKKDHIVSEEFEMLS